MKLCIERSLTARTTILFALIACVVIGSLGAYFYHSAEVSLRRRADVVLDKTTVVIAENSRAGWRGVP